ncbi:hypothetical protein L8P89_00515 [Enterobacter roggenkampii]|uniref:hypothetical protein n=1 Tax=Enterobacter roggenkampii TaxID=1812935 RepID=UPI002002BC01|nr:hypothetical protein [Enterobacter roggenkampii]MCK7073774.1 hypothetical protein [Enterobacter roggenkampii]HCM9501970.1 hypothetical protein [Enterobacter roggenkampii]
MKIEDFVCAAPPTASLSGLGNCMLEIEMPSPIDFYIKNSREIIQYGTTERLSQMDKLGGLLLLGLISSAEGYFRSILSETLDICPMCKSTSADKQINLGGILWHGKDEFRRSAFEHMSFASAKELTAVSKNYLGFDLKGGIFNSILKDYDAVCHLRHGLIHNAGILPGRNAVQIDIQSYSKPVEIRIDFAFLQNAAAAIDSLVVTFNRALFSEMCGRWANHWRSRSDWIPNDERRKFLQIWNIFACKTELHTRQGKSRLTPSKCMEKIKDEYNI